MLDVELLEHVADYYGSFSIDEFAERLGVNSDELMEELETLIERSLDTLTEEMGYGQNEEAEGDD